LFDGERYNRQTRLHREAPEDLIATSLAEFF
jgi:hypothetical protein